MQQTAVQWQLTGLPGVSNQFRANEGNARLSLLLLLFFLQPRNLTIPTLTNCARQTLLIALTRKAIKRFAVKSARSVENFQRKTCTMDCSRRNLEGLKSPENPLAASQAHQNLLPVGLFRGTRSVLKCCSPAGLSPSHVSRT